MRDTRMCHFCILDGSELKTYDVNLIKWRVNCFPHCLLQLFFKMQTVFPYFYRSWWPQKISLKRNMYSPFIFKTVFCTIFCWGKRSLPLAVVSLKISWKYPEIGSSEDRAKHCFYKWMEFSKGQIISEQNFGVLNFPKKQRNYCENFCPSL